MCGSCTEGAGCNTRFSTKPCQYEFLCRDWRIGVEEGKKRERDGEVLLLLLLLLLLLPVVLYQRLYFNISLKIDIDLDCCIFETLVAHSLQLREGLVDRNVCQRLCLPNRSTSSDSETRAQAAHPVTWGRPAGRMSERGPPAA